MRPTAPASTGSPSSPRSAMLKPPIGGPIEPCLIAPGGRVEGRQADLGHPVALDDREAGGGGELGQQLGRDLVGPGPADPQRGEVARLQVVVADQRRERRRDHRQHGRLVLAQQRQQLVAVGGARDDDPAADRERAQRPEERADVRHRGAGQEDVVGVELEGGGGAGDHPAQRLARVGDALGRPGAARGEEDRGGLGGVGGRLVRGQRLAVEQRLEARAPSRRSAALLRLRGRRRRSTPQLEAGGELARRHVLGPLDVGEQRLGAAHLERVVDLAEGVAVVERRDDQPGLEAGEVVDDQVDPVRHQRRDPVARLQPEPAVAAGQARRSPPRAPARSATASAETIASLVRRLAGRRAAGRPAARPGCRAGRRRSASAGS